MTLYAVLFADLLCDVWSFSVAMAVSIYCSFSEPNLCCNSGILFSVTSLTELENPLCKQTFTLLLVKQ